MKRKYLLIDDNEAFAENVAEILTDTGAEVWKEHSAAGGLEAAGRQRFDVVVTDMKMPGGSGADFIRLLRQVDPGVPVVVLSAFTQDAQLDEAKRFGLLAFLSKPMEIDRLLELLERARRDATVMLLEDDEALRDSLTDILTAHGFTVCAYGSLRQLDALQVSPALALVDLRLPGEIDGAALELIQKRFPQTNVIVVTALAEPLCDRSLEVVHKPFDTRSLVARMEALTCGEQR
jgi:two-component system, response regulator PdtaR